MLKLLLVSPDETSLSGLASALLEHSDVDWYWTDSGEKGLNIALETASEAAIDLVVTDEMLGDMSGLEFAGRLISVNPMINCASVSGLSPENFHDAGEGLGLMAQLPVQPGKEDANKLLRRLRQLKNLTADMKIYGT